MNEACEVVQADLVAYLDGELEAAGRDAVERHLEECPACREELEALRLPFELLDRLEAPPAPSDGLAARILAAASPAPLLEEEHARLRTLAVGLALAAAILVAVGIALLQHRPPPGHDLRAAQQPPQEPADAEPTPPEVDPRDLAVIRNLEVLEQLELLENLEMLENLELLDEVDLEDFEES